MAVAVKVPTRQAPALRSIGRRVDPPALVAWTVPFVLVFYLALRDGGYDQIVRGQVGVTVWWVVLLGALSGLLPSRIGVAGWIAIALLTAFAAWSGIAVGWSENAESTVAELGRLAAYLGVLVLVIALQGATAARHTINGLASAIGLVTVLAVLSRLHPESFPANQHLQVLGPVSSRKLGYPLNYWNALADFAAIGVPLLVVAAIGARRIVWRAVAAATLPLSAVCVYLTVSRGGVIALGIGVAVVLVLVPRRLEASATLLVAAAAGAILIAATSRHPAVTAGTPTPTEMRQGTVVLWLSLMVCVGTALLQAAIALASTRLARPRLLCPDRRVLAVRALVGATVVLLAAIALAVPSRLAHAWHDFKQPNGVIVPTNDNNIFSRLGAANGNSRYQFWQAALHANATHRWQGIGPGTFQFWWSRHATASGFVRNAHSIYFETLAETGIIGLAVLGGLLLWFVAVAIGRLLRAPPAQRLWLAGASAGLAVFLFSAAVEWVWQLAAVAVAALTLGGVIVAGDGDGVSRARWPSRALLAVLSLVALGAVLVPLGEQVAIRQSQAAVSRGQLSAALQDSISAQRLEPFAATPRLQEALVLEQAGDLGAAAAAAQAATVRGSTDWTTWLTLARIEARRGRARAAIAALRRARSLNPRSGLFQ